MQTNVHVRGGSVLPMQQSAMTVATASTTPYSLLAALDTDGKATGSLYMDDGEQIELSVFLEMEYTAGPLTVVDDDEISGSVTSKVKTATDPAYITERYIESIQIAGILQGQNFTNTVIIIEECTAVAYVIGRELEITGSVTVASATIDIAFTPDQMFSIMSEFTLVWTCEYDGYSDDPDKNSNDDESGWNALPQYGQALIIIVIILAMVSVAAGVYVYVKSKKDTAGNRRPENEPLLDLT
jgi:hypothetical protein